MNSDLHLHTSAHSHVNTYIPLTHIATATVALSLDSADGSQSLFIFISKMPDRGQEICRQID